MRATKFVILITMIALAAGVISIPVNAGASDSNSAHMIIQTGNGIRSVKKITFNAPISGLEALQASGVEVVTHDLGGGFVGICAIDGVGCPAENCFCDTKYWENSYWDGNAWQMHTVGANATSLEDGAVDGWRWGEFGSGSLAPATYALGAAYGLDWLHDQQQADGGYGSNSSTVETLLSIGSNQIEARQWRTDDGTASLFGFFLAKGDNYARVSSAAAGKLAVGLAGTRGCYPLTAKKPLDYFDPITGKFSTSSGEQAWAILGMLSLGQEVPEEALDYLKSKAQSDGGWEWADGFTSDTNTTSLAIQALISAGEPSDSSFITNGLIFLAASQNDDGGFPYDPDSPWGTASDANSTAYAIQAISAAGQDPGAAPWKKGDATPLDCLLAFQLPNGSFEWQTGQGANLNATQQAIPALIGRHYPLEISGVDQCQGSFFPVIRR